MAIKILKLVNGEDIISEIENYEITLNNPARLMMFPTESGGMGVGLVPWCPYSDKEKFKIDPVHVITEVEEDDVPEELRNEYIEKFGSGLQIPPKKSIIT